MTQTMARSAVPPRVAGRLLHSWSNVKACLVATPRAGGLEPRIVLADLSSDRFEIEYQIPGGGMGEVFRGRDRASGAAVAIKVLTDARAHRTARFAREVELLSQLSHPGIVR